MAGMVDWFYPDNKNRQDRLDDLTADCSMYQRNLAVQKLEFEASFASVNKMIVDAYAKIRRDVEYSKITLPNVEAPAEVVSIIAGLGVIPAVYKGMNVAWTSWMLHTGRIGEAALVKLIGYPRWFKIARGGAALAVTLALECIITSIVGAVQRNELRKAIQESLAPRRNLCTAERINELVISQMLLAMEFMTWLDDRSVEETGEHLSPEKYAAEVDNCVKKALKTIKSKEAQLEREVDIILAARDVSSWTNEDNANCMAAHCLASDSEVLVPYLNGSLVATQGEAPVYLIMDGKRCHIPSLEVYQRLFTDWNLVHFIERDFLYSMAVGESLSHDAGLIPGDESAVAYLYSNGKKYAIRSTGDFNKAGFNSDTLKRTASCGGVTQVQADFVLEVADW